MVKVEIHSPGEVFGHNPEMGMSPEDVDYLLAETEELAEYWRNAYKEALTVSSGWEDFRRLISNAAVAQTSLVDRHTDDPEIKIAIENVNNVFGTVPNMVDAQANLLQASVKSGRGRELLFYSKEDLAAIRAGNEEIDITRNALKMAKWQNDSIKALLLYGRGEITPPKTFIDNLGQRTVLEPALTLPDFLMPAIEETFRVAYPNEIAERELNKIFTGLYGPIRVALAAKMAGLVSYLPPPDWDVGGKIDLILRDDDKPRIFAVQIKSTSKPPDESSLYLKTAPLMEVGGREIASSNDWYVLENFCERVAKSPGWLDSGIEVIPRWVTIYGAQKGVANFKLALFGREPSWQEVGLLESSLKEG